MKLLLDRVIINKKTTAQGISLLGVILSFWFAPEQAKVISTSIASIWVAIKFLQEDK